jgi:hypothetical protein
MPMNYAKALEDSTMPEQDILSKDRRKQHRRRGLASIIRFRRLRSLPSGKPDSYHEGHLIDLSLGGACFYAEESLEQGEKIEYFMTLRGSNNTLDGIARVMHTREDNQVCFVGIQFLA